MSFKKCYNKIDSINDIKSIHILTIFKIYTNLSKNKTRYEAVCPVIFLPYKNENWQNSLVVIDIRIMFTF